MQADALLLCQYNIFEAELIWKFNNNIEPVASKDVIRVGQLFNRATTLLWDCFMVCGLTALIVISL